MKKQRENRERSQGRSRDKFVVEVTQEKTCPQRLGQGAASGCTGTDTRVHSNKDDGANVC